MPISRQALERLTRGLLALVAGSLALTVGVLVWHFRSLAEIRSLEARLLSERGLQQELLRGGDSDHAVYPHVDREIGYVLNPYLERATLHGPAGGDYPVNALGLRGAEIEPGTAGVTRVVLVGDSVLFGWKLDGPERIGEVLGAIVDERLGPGRFEFPTVALPGWNVRSEHAFLMRHLDRIAPDVVVWSQIRNDLHDVAGATPPGIKTSWNSPHKEGLTPFSIARDFQRDLLVPSLIERWDANLGLVRSFEEVTETPVVLLWWRPRGERLLFERHLRRIGWDPPRVVVPEGVRYDSRWAISRTDQHPTPWGARQVALGLLGALVERGHLPAVELDAQEREVIARFRDASARPVDQAATERFVQSIRDRLPLRFVAGEDGAERAVLFGLDEARMSSSGMLCLRVASDARLVVVELDAPVVERGAPARLTLTVRDAAGRSVREERALAPGANRIEIGLPPAARQELLEIAWSFDRVRCEGPSACVAAELRRVEPR